MRDTIDPNFTTLTLSGLTQTAIKITVGVAKSTLIICLTSHAGFVGGSFAHVMPNADVASKIKKTEFN
jgi:hypothetical protein